MSENEEKFKVIDRRIRFDEEAEPKKEDKVKKEKAETSAGQTFARIDFSSFILSLGQTALIQMGEETDPITNRREKNLPQAKEMIDLIELLQEKTMGNLTREEEVLMQNLIYTLKMRYVKATSK